MYVMTPKPVVNHGVAPAHLDTAPGGVADDVDQGAHGLHVEVVLARGGRCGLVVGAPEHQVCGHDVPVLLHKLLLHNRRHRQSAL